MSAQQPVNYTLANKAGGDGAIDISDGFSDLEKFYMISNSAICNEISDIVQYTGAGLMRLGAGDTARVSIAMFAADSYLRMVEAVDAATAKYNYLHGNQDDMIEENSIGNSLAVYPGLKWVVFFVCGL